MNTLEEIGRIYKIEESISGLDPGKRCEARQELSKNLVEKLFTNWKK